MHFWMHTWTSTPAIYCVSIRFQCINCLKIFFAAVDLTPQILPLCQTLQLTTWRVALSAIMVTNYYLAWCRGWSCGLFITPSSSCSAQSYSSRVHGLAVQIGPLYGFLYLHIWILAFRESARGVCYSPDSFWAVRYRRRSWPRLYCYSRHGRL